MINLTVVIDNDEAIRKLRELQNVAKTTTSSVVKDSERMDASWQQMKNTLMSLTAGVSFAALSKQVVQIRGEVQQLEVAFETMLGSKEKADTLMSEIIDLAAKTPFGLQDVSNATKMLLAYGSTAEEVTGEIKMLGNIASGLSIPLNDLIYLYGTTRTQGRMFTMDLRQFMGRGIPLAEELAKQFGVTKDKVGELVTAGKVGFDDMAKALQAMSSEGGKFNNLMDKQSATISGQISNLEDSIYQMFNEIGESSEGVINDLISGASWVVEHYQEILNVLKYVIAAYGSYKAALILVAAAQKAMALASSIKMYAQLATYITSAKDAMLLFNMVVKANPIGLLLSVLGTIGVAIWSFADGTEEATKQMGSLEKAARDEYVEVNRLVATLQQGNTTEQERNDILAQLKSINPDIVKGISDEADMTATLTSNLKSYNEEQIKKIQLSAIGDKQRAAITDKANAEIGVGEAQAAAENAVKQMQTALNMGELTFDTRRTNANFSRISNAERAKIEQLITAEISRILQSDLSAIDKVKAIRNIEVMTNPSISGGYRKTGVSDVGNVNLKGIIDTYTVAEEAYKSADEALVKITEDNEQLADILGLTGKKTEDNAEAAKTYAQAYAEAQKAYINAQKNFKAVQNDKNATTEDWQTAKDELESKKKAYEALGGVTSTKAQTDAEKKAKEAAELAKKLQYEADQAVIDAMAEGTDKKIAQIEFDYRKRGDAIRQQEADLMAKQDGALTTEQQALFSVLYKGNSTTLKSQYADELFANADAEADAELQRLFEEQDAWNEHIIAYGTFKERMVALTIKYNQAIADAQTEGEKKTLEHERDAILAEYEVQASDWAKELADKTTAQLNKMITELQAQVDAKQAAFDALGSSDSQQAKDYQKEINTLKAKIKELQEQLNKANKAVKDDNWADATQVFQNISKAATDAADGIAEIDEEAGAVLRTIAQLASTATNLIGAIQAVETASAAAAGTISAMEKASAILAVIGAAIQAVSVLISLFKGSDEVEQTMRQFKELNAELERFRKLARIDSVEGTIFGDNPFGNYVNNLEEWRGALDELESTQRYVADKWKQQRIAELEIAASRRGGRHEEYYSKEAEKLKNAQIDYIEAIASMRVVLNKKGTETSTLGDMLPELFAGGKISLKGLQELKESDVWGKLDQKNKKLIDELIADWERYEKATEAVEKYLSDVFGDLGYTMTNALVEAFENGTDAAQAFGEAASDVIEKLSTDMIHAALVQPILDKYQQLIDEENLKEMSPEERIARLTELIGQMSQEVLAVKDEVDATAAQVRQDAEDAGITGVYDGNYSSSATSKGFQAMSQETGSELNGRFTDIQGQTHRIADAVDFCRNLYAQNLTHVTSINYTVASIHNDTTLIEKHTRVLGQMGEDLASIKRAIDDGAI